MNNDKLKSFLRRVFPKYSFSPIKHVHDFGIVHKTSMREINWKNFLNKPQKTRPSA